MKPAQVPAAREIVRAFRADDVQVVIEPRAIGVELAGQVYGVCAETIRRLQDEQGFPCVRIGTRRLVPVAAADAWFAARALRDTLPPSAAVASRQADELAAADDSTFAQAFHAEMARTS